LQHTVLHICHIKLLLLLLLLLLLQVTFRHVPRTCTQPELTSLMLSGLVSTAVTMPSVERGTSSAELLQA
jgi:hypothetical protein